MIVSNGFFSKFIEDNSQENISIEEKNNEDSISIEILRYIEYIIKNINEFNFSKEFFEFYELSDITDFYYLMFSYYFLVSEYYETKDYSFQYKQDMFLILSLIEEVFYFQNK